MGFCALLLLVSLCQCSDDDSPPDNSPIPVEPFYFGVDLSYVNQVVDHNGVYKDEGVERSPYRIFTDNGANLVRLRLWHNPLWTKEVYGEEGEQLYSDIEDVEKAIALAKQHDMQVLLDFHYSDIWADPGSQEPPLAWSEIKDFYVLEDSVYEYTLRTLSYLKGKGLMPEFVQLGNEINCGMFFSNTSAGFPTCDACNGEWQKLGGVLNSAIHAVRETSEDTKVVLHVADPKNVQWWFDNIKSNGLVTDFDIIGFSYYPLWHTTVSVFNLSDNIADFIDRYGKDVMILETAYPWTLSGDDNYTNLMGGQDPIPGFEYTQAGQFEMLKKLTEEVKAGGGIGIIYWEPGWISSDMKDLWGTGSAWENCALFNFTGDAIPGIEYMATKYE
jgi:arabinogalactan endo-1,4-beta-galactosidase